jgi:hypothetical protein
VFAFGCRERGQQGAQVGDCRGGEDSDVARSCGLVDGICEERAFGWRSFGGARVVRLELFDKTGDKVGAGRVVCENQGRRMAVVVGDDVAEELLGCGGRQEDRCWRVRTWHSSSGYLPR